MSESESEVEAAHPRVQMRHLTRVYRRVTLRVYRPGADRRTAVTVKRMTSPYVQNLVVLATRGGDGEGRGGGGGRIN